MARQTEKVCSSATCEDDTPCKCFCAYACDLRDKKIGEDNPSFDAKRNVCFCAPRDVAKFEETKHTSKCCRKMKHLGIKP